MMMLTMVMNGNDGDSGGDNSALTQQDRRGEKTANLVRQT